ncbi:MAG: hypothetical protein ACOZNI_19880 [Myxococcota bacterium]
MPLPPRTKGAWVIGQCLKLRKVDARGQFSNIESAGKAGILLSTLAGSSEDVIKPDKARTLAQAKGINPKLELPSLLEMLKDRALVQVSREGEVALLGLTHANVLENTSAMFEDLKPDKEEQAVLEMAELVSGEPVRTAEMSTFVSDNFQLTKGRTADLLAQAEEIGFIDAEEIDPGSDDKLYFNGNIFRITDARKTQAVLNSLSSAEEAKLREFDEVVGRRGYSTVEEARTMLGEKVFEKLQAIALYDVNCVANPQERVLYVTKPGAFGKYNAWEDDTLDYAKMLVSCLAYGMTRRGAATGKIDSLDKLTNIVRKLNRGEWVGPSTAAGEDYRCLEVENVIATQPERYGRYWMRLLKRDVGEVALQVLTKGTASPEALLELPGAPAATFVGPEEHRVGVRKKRTVATPDRKVVDYLQAIRTGRK